MLSQLKIKLESFLNKIAKDSFGNEISLPQIELELPADFIYGDFSSNVALKSAKIMKKPPLVIAEGLASLFSSEIKKSELSEYIEKIEVKAPGFINFYLSAKAAGQTIEMLFQEEENYGKSNFGKKEKIQIEFVSANPTGPLSVAHARQAAVGDALANILKYIGFDVTKEYYVNDEGNQIVLLGESIKTRAIEILGGQANLPENGYQGEYIKDMAQIFISENKITKLEDIPSIKHEKWMQFGVKYLMDVIRKELDDFRVHFDVWSYQSKKATLKSIAGMVEGLRAKGFVYEHEGAVWFKSTQFGDDKDRVLRKSDGAYTYLTPDIVYHKDKFDRGFSRVFNIWGPDHHGYIPRIKAAAQALGHDHNSIEVLIVQLATLYKNGEVLSMSTRKGQYVSMREVMEEVGVDAARFFFLMRHIKAHLDFDLELAKKETAENPVFYIQYAYARINSINSKAEIASFKSKQTDFCLLKEEEELVLIKKIGFFTDILISCYQQLDPYPLVSYLLDLATSFHRFYDRYKVIDEGNKELSAERLALANATKVTLGIGLRLLGLSTPERM